MSNDFKLMLIQIFIIIVLIVVIIYLIRQNVAIKFERRIGRYSIEPLKNEDVSVLDGINKKINIFIVKCRKFMNKIYLFRLISNRYDKYITYGDTESLDKIDFVTKKLLIGFCLVILSIFSQVLQNRVISLFEMIIVFFIGYFILDIYLVYSNKLRLKKIQNQILKAVIIMNNAFKAGNSTIQAVEIAKNELPEPLKYEFRKIYNDMKYGLSVDVVFQRFAKRVDLEEIRYLSSSLTILNKTGGNIVQVFSSIEKALFDKKKLKEELRNLTVSSNLIVKILLSLPFVFVLIIYIMNPAYFDPFFESALGYVALAMIFVILLLYVFFLQKIMKVKV